MKRISSLIACGVIALGFATSSNAQLRGSALILTNTNGTVKMTMTNPATTGVCLDQYLTLCRPGNALSTVTLIAPAGNGNRNFDFPTTGGTILTNNSIIDASQITNLTGSLPTVAGNTTINVTTELNGDYTIGLNLDNSNTWTATQTFPITLAQGNALINSINMGDVLLSGYVTSSDFNTAITNIEGDISNLQTSLTNLTNASANYLEAGDLQATAPITLTGTTFGMATSPAAGTYTNANITVDAYGRVTAASTGSAAAFVDPRFSTGAYVATNGNLNNDLVVGSDRYFRTSSTQGAYGLRSMTTGTDGDIVVVVNVTAVNMTITNEKPGTPAGYSKIITNSGADVVTSGIGSASFVYDAVADAWIMISFVP